MNLNDKQVKLIQDYRDKSYILNVLMCRSYERFNLIKVLTNIPIILSSSIMAILNSSSFDGNEMRLPNIIMNTITAMVLSMTANFNVSEKEVLFQGLSHKFLKLCHQIEDDLTNNLELIQKEEIQEHIKNYDLLIEQIVHPIPKDIQNKVKLIYKSSGRCLPAFLNCEQNFVTEGEIGNIV